MLEVKRDNYQFSHGRKPRGRGNWAFKLIPSGEVTWFQGFYTEGIKEARRMAKRKGDWAVEVLP